MLEPLPILEKFLAFYQSVIAPDLQVVREYGRFLSGLFPGDSLGAAFESIDYDGSAFSFLLPLLFLFLLAPPPLLALAPRLRPKP